MGESSEDRKYAYKDVGALREAMRKYMLKTPTRVNRTKEGKRRAEQKAATAVRLDLPKSSLEELRVFFYEDEVRYGELKKYLLDTVRMDDEETFMENVFRRVITDGALQKGDLPNVVAKLVTEVALEGGAYQDEDAVREAMRKFLLETTGRLTPKTGKKRRKLAGNKSSDDDSPKLVAVVIKKVKVMLQ